MPKKRKLTSDVSQQKNNLIYVAGISSLSLTILVILKPRVLSTAYGFDPIYAVYLLVVLSIFVLLRIKWARIAALIPLLVIAPFAAYTLFMSFLIGYIDFKMHSLWRVSAILIILRTFMIGCLAFVSLYIYLRLVYMKYIQRARK